MKEFNVNIFNGIPHFIILIFLSLLPVGILCGQKQVKGLYIGKSSDVLGSNLENMRTPYFKVASFGWLSAYNNEYHDAYYYPTFNDYNPPGWFWCDPQNIGIGDFNGDGYQDVVITWYIGPHTIERKARAPFTVLLNNRDGSLRPAPEIFENDSTLRRFFAYRTAVEDFNSDGKADILATSMGMIKRNPNGTYTNEFEPIPLALSTPSGKYVDASSNIEGQEKGGLPKYFGFGHDLAVGDVNRDGFPDVYTGKILLLNDGKGVFKNATDSLPRELKPATYIMSSAIGDLNNDGVKDIVSFYADGSPESGYIFLSRNGEKSFKNRQLIKLPPGKFGLGNTKFNYVALFDADRNGFLDIVVSVTRANPYYEGRNIQLIMNKGNGVFTDETSLRVKTSDYLDTKQGEGSLFIVDANNDGLNDIIHAGGELVIYINKGGSFEVMDRKRYAYVERWQIKGYENFREFYANEKLQKAYPINLDNKGGIDLFSTVDKPHLVWPPIESNETVFYSILSLGNCKATNPLFDKNNFSFCAGDSLKLTISNFKKGDSLYWNTNNMVDAVQSKTKYFRNTDKLFVLLKDSMGCTASSDTISLTKRSLPSTPTITMDPSNYLVSSATFGNLWFKDGISTSDTTQIIKPSVTGTYTVKSVQNGCNSLLSSSYYYLVTGISQLEDGKYINFFPNPTDGNLEISHNLSGLKSIYVSIYSSSGKKLIEKSDVLNGDHISLQGLLSGVYLIRFYSLDGKNNIVSKIIKL